MTCSFPECGRPRHTKGLCNAHYKQKLYRGTLTPIGERVRKPCSFDGCDRLRHSYGLCDGHAKQRRKGRELTPLGDYVRSAQQRVCSFDGCGRPHAARGFCDTHARQARKGIPLRPIGESVRRDPATSLPFEPIRAYALAHGYPIPGKCKWITPAEADEVCVRIFRVHPFFVYGDQWWNTEEMENVA